MKQLHCFVHRGRSFSFRKNVILFDMFRDVWPTEKAFGHDDIGAEEEFNLLREIFMTSNMTSRHFEKLNFFSRKFVLFRFIT